MTVCHTQPDHAQLQTRARAVRELRTAAFTVPVRAYSALPGDPYRSVQYGYRSAARSPGSK
jgi:hypothetical protein